MHYILNMDLRKSEKKPYKVKVNTYRPKGCAEHLITGIERKKKHWEEPVNIMPKLPKSVIDLIYGEIEEIDYL